MAWRGCSYGAIEVLIDGKKTMDNSRRTVKDRYGIY